MQATGEGNIQLPHVGTRSKWTFQAEAYPIHVTPNMLSIEAGVGNPQWSGASAIAIGGCLR